MRRVLILGLLLLLRLAPGFAQVTIRSDRALPVPEPRIQLLFETTCQVVAEEFHVDVKIVRYSLTLVLGAESDLYSENGLAGDRVVYMKEWSETKFTATVMVLAIRKVTQDTNHYRYLLSRTLNRAGKISPVSVTELSKP
jgi:hypothetical protein